MFTFLRKIRNSLIESSPAKALAKEGGSARKYLFVVRHRGDRPGGHWDIDCLTDQ